MFKHVAVGGQWWFFVEPPRLYAPCVSNSFVCPPSSWCFVSPDAGHDLQTRQPPDHPRTQGLVPEEPLARPRHCSGLRFGLRRLRRKTGGRGCPGCRGCWWEDGVKPWEISKLRSAGDTETYESYGKAWIAGWLNHCNNGRLCKQRGWQQCWLIKVGWSVIVCDSWWCWDRLRDVWELLVVHRLQIFED